MLLLVLIGHLKKTFSQGSGPDSSLRKSTIEEESVMYKHLLACLAFHVIVAIQFSISLSDLVVH